MGRGKNSRRCPKCGYGLHRQDWRWLRCLNTACGYKIFKYLNLSKGNSKKSPQPYTIRNNGVPIAFIRSV